MSYQQENQFIPVPNGINVDTGKQLSSRSIHPHQSIQSILRHTESHPFTMQRQGLPVENRGVTKKQSDSFFQNGILYRGKYYYPYVENGKYFFPYFFQKQLYYYPFPALSSCFCRDSDLNYKINVTSEVSGRCIPAVNCRHCDMQYYYMCGNEFPTGG